MINAGFRCGMTNPTAAPILRLAHLDPDQHRAAAYMVLLEIMATIQSHGRLSISGLGWSLSATLVVLFVLCMLAALFVPLRLAHGWVGLLSDAPINSSRVWIDGLIWSIVLGWLIALIFGTIYNWIVARRALQEVS